MVDERLVEYIKSNKAKGLDRIRDYLLHYGYNAKDVDEAIKLAVELAQLHGETLVKKRNPYLAAFFSVITLGLYWIIWLISTNEEMKKLGAGNTPDAMLLVGALVPIAGIGFLFYYLWKYTKSIEEVSHGSRFGLIYTFWIVFFPVAVGLCQVELNKHAL